MANSAEQQRANLRKLLEIYSGRLKVLREIESVSLKIQEEIEAHGEEATETVDALTIKQDALMEQIKEAEMAARYGENALSDNHKRQIKEVRSAVRSSKGDDSPTPAFEKDWAEWLFKNFTEYKALAKTIRAIDEKNMAAIRGIMDGIKHQLKSLKDNKRMVDKFSDEFFEPSSVGTLMNEKR
jgi:hypothetical protein